MTFDGIGINLRPTPAIGNRIYRSADPTVISDAGAERLRRELSVAALIDLRTRVDVSRHGAPLGLLRAGISWVRSPLEGYSNAIIDGPEPSDWPGGPTAYSDYYVGILENSGSSLARMFRSVARNLHAPLLIGCHCGKDRSGLLIAALLSVCGYHRDVIVEDFARTGDYLLPHADHFEDKWLRRGHTKQQYLHRLRTHAGTLRLALEKIDSRWGSMELLLLNRAVDATDIRAIRSQIGSSHAS